MHLTVLGSGSSGNSAVISHGDTRILVDAGLTAVQLLSRLEAVGVSPDSLTALVLTHEHSDHTRGIDVLTRKFSLPIYCNALTKQIVSEQFKNSAERQWKLIQTGQSFRISEVEIECFPVPHDAVDPMGFIFRCPGYALGVVSDLGHVTRQILQKLRSLHTLFIEANYDGTLLQNDRKRPFSTKQRISSQHGHLSNHQTAELIATIAHDGLERVVLGHLSSDCNTPTLASTAIQNALTGRGFPNVEVHCATQNEPTPAFPVRLRALCAQNSLPARSATLVQAELF